MMRFVITRVLDRGGRAEVDQTDDLTRQEIGAPTAVHWIDPPALYRFKTEWEAALKRSADTAGSLQSPNPSTRIGEAGRPPRRQQPTGDRTASGCLYPNIKLTA
jgi:hypothetical protein